MTFITKKPSNSLTFRAFLPYTLSMPILVFIMLILLSAPARADIYKYVDENGIVLFSDSRTEGAVKVPNNGYSSSGTYIKVPDAELDRMIRENCEKYAMPYDLIKAVIKAESNFNPYAVSPKGARGLMQLMPETAYSMGVYNPMDASANIEGGIRYLRYLLDKFGGNRKLALAAYNAGPDAVERYGTIPPYKETRDYVDKVISTSGGNNTKEPPYTPKKPEPDKAKNKEPEEKAVKVKALEKPPVIYKVPQEDGSILYTNSLPQRF